jgi:hypothetical protein
VAELTVLEAKLGEVIGLAMAAQGATEKVAKLVDNEQIVSKLEKMNEEAAETERRATEAASNLDGKKTAILEKARETKQEAQEMMSTYLGSDADGLDGMEFLTMAEAGEVGHVEILAEVAKKAGPEAREILEVAEWAMPVQQRHFEQTRNGALTLAREEDPNGAA